MTETSNQENIPQWPSAEALVPTFSNAREAAAFVAQICGLTMRDVQFTDSDPEAPLSRPSAIFAGIPQVNLIYLSDAEQAQFSPTIGARDLANKVLDGSYKALRLVQPLRTTPKPVPFGPRIDARIEETSVLMSPSEIDPDSDEEVIGTLSITNPLDSESKPHATLLLEDGRRLELTPGASTDLLVAEQDTTRLDGQSGVFRIGLVTDQETGEERLAVVEVYFAGE